MASVNYVEMMRAKAAHARENMHEDNENNEDWREKKKEVDILKFFETEICKNAIEKMEKRAEKGCYSANILEYHFNEFFYINKKGEVIRIPEFQQIQGYYVHRIHFAVKSDFFQEKLQEYVHNLGNEMQFDCWYPGRDKINVITLFWGPTKTHKWELVWGPSEQLSDASDPSTPRSKADDEESNEPKIENLKIEEPKKEESYASKTANEKKGKK